MKLGKCTLTPVSDDPTAHPWSSCASHCGLRQEAFLSPHREYITLAATPEARATAYRQLLHEALSDDDLKAIRTCLQQQRPLGRDDFRAMVEAKTQRFAGLRPAHRHLAEIQTGVSEPDPVFAPDPGHCGPDFVLPGTLALSQGDPDVQRRIYRFRQFDL